MMSSKTDNVGRHLEKFLQEVKRQIPALETDLENIKDLKRKVDSENFQDLREEVNRLKKENEELKSAVELDRHRRDERQDRKYEDSKLKNRNLQNAIDQLVAEKLTIEDDCHNQKIKIQELEQTVQNLRQIEADKLQIENKYKKLREKIGQTERELEETKLRLSSFMGHQLSDSNPDIADLSDPTRPTKIAEMFSSLYDDEYTNAFEEIDAGSTDNKETCGKLLNLLLEAKRFCDKKAEEQLQALKRECLGQDILNTSSDTLRESDYSLKEMKDIRKKNAKRSVKNVYNKFTDYMTHTKMSSIFKHPYWYPKTVEYVKKCVELCWFMAVQDPPLVFGPLPSKFEGFDEKLYKCYTTSGSKVDFVVWPVLYLHKNGSVLCKGVLEPIKESHRYRKLEAEERHNYYDIKYGRQEYHDGESTEPLTRPVSTGDITVSTRDNNIESLLGRGRTVRRSPDNYDLYDSRIDRHQSTSSYLQETLPTVFRTRSPLLHDSWAYRTTKH